jgi:hypothetical protein
MAGCAEPEPQVSRVKLTGSFLLPDGIDPGAGDVKVRLFHAWALEGELRHPREEIEDFDATLGEYEHTFDYPVDEGEGLLVFAWLDVDGDGVHCTPQVRLDRSGLTEVQSTGVPPAEVSADVLLEVPCAGPDWFYPPAP